jgi:hypothetical protein
MCRSEIGKRSARYATHLGPRARKRRPQLFSNHQAVMPKNDLDDIRKATAPDMACTECRSQMMVCPSGLVCERGCGRVRKALYSPRLMAKAWPERTCKSASYATKIKHHVLEDKMPPANGQASFIEE